jgi:sorting and assembly machinery component 37
MRYCNLDASHTPSQRAATTALKAYIRAHLAPLLALSLYVSSANWAATTRPAYSTLLPFPLAWTEPPALRKAMAARAEHLGLSDLDTDAPDDAEDPSRPSLLRIPERLRPRPRAGVSAALSPEDKASIRLAAAAEDALAPLAAHLRDGRTYFADRPGSLDCLAFAYLALMLYPPVPRRWLADALRASFAPLCAFTDRMRGVSFEPAGYSLEWEGSRSGSWGDVAVRWAWGFVDGFPGVGEEAYWWLLRMRKIENGVVEEDKERAPNPDLDAAVRMALCVPVVAAAVLLARRMPLMGMPVHSWVRPRIGLGAAGAMFGGLFNGGLGGNASVDDGVSRGFTGSVGSGFDFEDVSIEVGRGKDTLVDITTDAMRGDIE